MRCLNLLEIKESQSICIVVGMSMVPENLVAIHSNMRVTGMAIVTDLCRPDALEPANIPKIIATAKETEPKLRKLILEFLQKV